MRTNERAPDGAAVLVRGLSRSFGGALALDGLDLEVRAGECLGLLGPNGAGKSTTVRVLSTLLARDGGEVSVLGLDPGRDGDRLRARIGVVPQELALYGPLSARQNLAFFGSLYGLAGTDLDAAIERALGIAGLAERAGERVERFSGGMKRRLNLVTALLHRPELVFLDEPTAGIDPQSRNRIFETVEELRSEGVTVVYTSHQLGEVERLCDRIVVLDHGRKVAEGTLAELQRLSGVHRGGAAALRFARVEDARRAAELCAAGGLAFDLVEELPDLERVFLDLTGHALRDGGAA